MKRKMRRFMAYLLVMLMCLTSLPLDALAQQVDTSEGFSLQRDAGGVTRLVLDPRSAVIAVNATQQFSATLEASGSETPLDAENCTWASENAGVATVDENGLVTGHSTGTATITCTYTANGDEVTGVAVVRVTEVEYRLTYESNYPDGAKRYIYTNGNSASVADAIDTTVADTYAPGDTATVRGELFSTINYDFVGYKGSDGKTYNVGDTIPMNANLTLTAQWEANDNSTSTQTIYVRYYYEDIAKPDDVDEWTPYIQKNVEAIVSGSGQRVQVTFVTGNNQDTLASSDSRLSGWVIDDKYYAFNQEVTVSAELQGNFGDRFYVVEVYPHIESPENGTAYAQFFVRKRSTEGYGEKDQYYSVGLGTISTGGLHAPVNYVVAGSDNIYDNVNEHVISAPSPEQIARLTNESLSGDETIRWYVIKDQSDGYHVDGVIIDEDTYWKVEFLDDDGGVIYTAFVEDASRLSGDDVPQNVIDGSILEHTLRKFAGWSVPSGSGSTTVNGIDNLRDALGVITQDMQVTATFNYFTGYEVRYVDSETKEEIHEPALKRAVVGTRINAADEVIDDIEGYTYERASANTLTVREGQDNILTLYYKKNEVTYTVEHWGEYLQENSSGLSLSDRHFEGKDRTLTVPAGTEITYELLAQQDLIRTDLTDEDLHIVPDQNGSYNYVYDAAQESGEAISGFRVFAEDNVIRIYYDRVLEKSTFDDKLGVTASDSTADNDGTHEIRQGKITVKTHYVGGTLDGQGASGDVYFVWHNRNMVDLAVTLDNDEYIINAIVAEQDDPRSNRFDQDASALVDNVTGNTTVHIYLTPKYTVEYYKVGTDTPWQTDEQTYTIAVEGVTANEGFAHDLSTSFTASALPTDAPAGYHYEGWTMGNMTVAPSASAGVADEYADENNVIKLYCGVVEDDQVTIDYVAVTQVDDEITTEYTGGTVSIPSEDLPPATGDAVGATATAENGYRFEGWYSSMDFGDEDLLTTDTFYRPEQANGVYAAATYYALFVYTGGTADEIQDITVNKAWVAPELATGTATIELCRAADGVEEEAVDRFTAVLGEEATNSHTFEVLPKYAPNSAEYTYKVYEIAVPEGYTSSIDTDGQEVALGGEVTVTNTKDSDTPEQPGKDAEVTEDENSIVVNGETWVRPGGTITYTITYYNHTNAAADVTITDTLHSELTLVKSETTEGYTQEGQEITWVMEDVPAFSGGEITLVVQVSEDAEAEQIGNTAYVQVGNESGQQVSPEETVDVFQPAIDVEKAVTQYVRDDETVTDVTGYTAAYGDVITYTVTITNTGNVALANVALKDSLVREIPNYPEAGIDLAEDGMASYTYTYTVTAGDVANGSIENTATATATAADDPNTQVTDFDTVTVNTDAYNPALTVKKTATSEQPEGGYTVGNTITYTVKVTNAGNVPLANITVTDERANAQFATSRTNVATIASLEPGASAELTVSYVLTEADIADANGSFENTVTAVAEDGTSGKDDETVTVAQPETGLQVAKTVTSITHGGAPVGNIEGHYAATGDVVGYQVVVTNTGNQTMEDVKVADTLLDAQGFANTTNLEGVTYAAGEGWTIASLAPQASVTITYTYTVQESDLGQNGQYGQIENIATARGEGDEEGEDDEPVPTRIQLTLTGESDTRAYTGEQQSLTGYTPSVSGLTIEGVSYLASGTEPGAYPGSFTGQDKIVISRDGDNVTDEYEVSYDPGTLTITNPTTQFVIATDSNEKDYDGTALTDYGYTLNGRSSTTTTQTSTEFTLLGEDVLEVTFTDNNQTADVVESTITDVGKVENYITYRVLRGDVDVTAQYANSIQVSYGTLEVTPREVTIVSNTNSKDYDGTALTDIGGTVNNVAFAAQGDENSMLVAIPETNETVLVTVTGTQTDAGNSRNTFTVAWADGANGATARESNYSIKTTEGALTVNPRKVTVIAASDEKEFDGTALTNVNYAVVGGHVESADASAFTGEKAIVGEQTISAAISGSQTVPGSSDNAVGDVAIAGGNPVNYDIKKVDGTLTVTDRSEDFAIELTAQNVSAPYDGQAHTAEMASAAMGEVRGVVDNTANTVTFTAENGAVFTLRFADFEESMTDAGEAAVGDEATLGAQVWLGQENVTGQFNITFTPGTLEVTPRPVTVIAISDEKVYDGTPLTNTNYAVVGGHVESADASAFTGEKAIVGEQTISAAISGSQTVPGSSDNAVGDVAIANGKPANYDIKTVDGTLTVNNRGEKYEITVVGNSDEVDYNGTEQSVTGFEKLTFTVNGQTYTVEGLTAQASGTNASQTPYAGTITGDAVVRDAEGNDVTGQFTVYQRPGSLTINPLALTVTTDDATKGYDGTALTRPSGTVNGEAFAAASGENSLLYTIDATGETVRITVSGTQTRIGSSSNAFEISWRGEAEGATAVESNYTLTETPGTLTVTGEEMDVGKEDGHEAETNYEYKLGDTIEYTITVTNRGDKAMTEITVTEETGNEIVSVSGEGVGEFEIAENGLSVTIASLEPGATATITAKHTVTQTDLYEETIGNTVNVSAKYDGRDIVDEAEDEVTTEGVQPRIVVEKAIAQVVRGQETLMGDGLTGYIADFGDVITYSVQVTNAGNVDLVNVQLTDPMWKQTAEAIGELAQGASSSVYQYSHTVTEADVAAGKIENTAMATGAAKGDASKTAQDADTVTVSTATAEPNLVVTKEVTSKPEGNDGYALGETISYKLTVQNTGNQSITEDITVADSLAGIVNTTVAENIVYSNGTWTIKGGLAARASEEITYTYMVQEADIELGYVANAVTASGGGHEDTDDETVETEDPNPSLSVTKKATGEPEEGGKYALDETVTYEVVVTNNGNVTLTNVVVTDERTGAVFTKIDGAEIANGTNAYTIASMAPNASHTFEVTYEVTEDDILDAADANGMLANRVTVEGENPDGEDPEPPQPGEAEVPVEEPNPSLSVTKSAMGEAPEDGYKQGDTVTYQVVVKNDGNLTLTNVVVTDERENAAFTTVEDANFEFDGNTVTIGEMLPNATYTFEVTYEVTEGDILAEGNTLVNTVNVTGDGPEGEDPDPEKTTEEVPVEKPKASLSVEKTSGAVEGTTYRAGDTITYTITVTNDGNLTVTNITLEDTLVEEKGIEVAGYDTPFDLEPGESKEFTYTYTVTGDDLGATGGTVQTFLENTATVEGKAPESEDPDEEIPDPEDEDEEDVPVGNKIAVTITAQDESWVYDGAGHSHPYYDIAIGDTSVTGQSGDYVYEGDTFAIAVAGSVTDVADTKEDNNQVTVAGITDANGVDRSGNYDLTLVDGTLTIEKRPVIVKAIDNLDNIYSDSSYGSNGVVAQSVPGNPNSGLVLGHVLGSSSVSGSATEVGYYEDALVPRDVRIGTSGAWYDLTANYAITYEPGDIEILPYELTVTAASDSKAFDGTPLTNRNYTIAGMNGETGTTFAGKTIGATVFGSQTNVGSSANTVTAVSINGDSTQLESVTPETDGRYKLGNFLVAVVNGTLTVNDRAEGDKFEIVLMANSGEEQYNGQPHTVSGLASATLEGSIAGTVDNENRTVTFTQNGATFVVTFPAVSATGTDVNRYPVGNRETVESGAKVSLGETDVTAQFSITFTPGTLEITKKPLTVTALDKTYYYSGALQGPNGKAFSGGDVPENATASGLAEGDSLTGVTVAGAQRNVNYVNSQVAPYEDELAPSAAVVTRNGVDVTGNYEIAYVSGDLTILPRGSEGDENGPLTITALDKTYYYNGELQGPNGSAFDQSDTTDLTVAGLVGGDSLSEVFIDGAQRNAGAYADELVPKNATVVNGGTDVTGNYEIAYVPGDLTILKRGSENDPNGPVTITPADRRKVYDAQPYALAQGETEDGYYALQNGAGNAFTITGLIAGDRVQAGTAQLAVTDGNGGQISAVDADTYSIEVSTELALYDADGVNVTDNYEITYETGTLTIAKRPVTLTANDNLGIVYDGKPHGENGVTPSQSGEGTGLVSGHTFAYDIDFEATDVGLYADALAIDESTVVILDGETDVTGNYDITCVSGDLEIIRRGVDPEDPGKDPEPPEDPDNPESWRVVIYAGDLDIIWGEDIEAKLAEAIAGGGMAEAFNLAEGHTLANVTFDVDYAALDAAITGEGVYEGWITIADAVIHDAEGNDVTDNYALTFVSGDVNVSTLNYTVHYYRYYGGTTTRRVFADRVVTGVKLGETYTEAATDGGHFTSFADLYRRHGYYMMSNTTPRYKIRPDDGHPMVTADITISANPEENVINFYFIPRMAISATVRYVYIGNDDLNHSETLYPYVLNQVITDISSRVLANTVEGYTVSRIEGLPLTIGPNEDRNVITVYYEPQVLTEILDLGVPTGASLGGLNVGDCCE